MSSLIDLPELVGFFSYSRRDDLHSQGALSRLRTQIHNELRLQLGFDFRLWQDTAAIPDGALWEGEIKRAISESVFFIPIVTPSSVGSKHCRLEFEAFLDREGALDRNNLIFPILYVSVPGLEKEELWRKDPLLSIIGTRQYIDWQKFRHRSFAEAEIAEKVEQYCSNIVRTLRQPWISPDQRRAAQDAEAQRTADLERQRIEQENQRQRAEVENRRRAEEATQAQAAADAGRQRAQAEASAREKADREKAEHQAAEKARALELASRQAAGSAEQFQLRESPDRKQEKLPKSQRSPAGLIALLSAAVFLLAAALVYLNLPSNSNPASNINLNVSGIDVPGCTMFRKNNRPAAKDVLILSTDTPRGKGAAQLAMEAEAAAKQRGLRVVLELFNDGVTISAVNSTDAIILCGPVNSRIDSEVRAAFTPVR